MSIETLVLLPKIKYNLFNSLLSYLSSLLSLSTISDLFSDSSFLVKEIKNDLILYFISFRNFLLSSLFFFFFIQSILKIKYMLVYKLYYRKNVNIIIFYLYKYWFNILEFLFVFFIIQILNFNRIFGVIYI